MSAHGTSRRAQCAAQCPLLGVKRTWRGLVSMSANDPKRTLAFQNDILSTLEKLAGRIINKPPAFLITIIVDGQQKLHQLADLVHQ